MALRRKTTASLGPKPRMGVATHVPEMVTILIAGMKTYSVHKCFLVYYSEYFRAALTGSWKEAEDQAINLDDVEPEVFELYLDWLYTQTHKSVVDAWVNHNNSKRVDDSTGKLLFQAYAFGDRVLSGGFCKLVNSIAVYYYATNIDRHSPTLADTQTILDAFSILPPHTPILRVLVDLRCLTFPGKKPRKNKDPPPALPYEYLAMVVDKYGEKVANNPEWFKEMELSPCDYHEHTSDHERKTCIFGKLKNKETGRKTYCEGWRLDRIKN